MHGSPAPVFICGGYEARSNAEESIIAYQIDFSSVVARTVMLDAAELRIADGRGDCVLPTGINTRHISVRYVTPKLGSDLWLDWTDSG